MKKTVLTGMALLLVLSGCSGGNGGGGQTGASGAGGEGAGNGASGGPTTILMNYNPAADQFPSGSDLNNNHILDWHKEKSGLDFTIELLPKDEPSQKIALILASGDVPDMMKIGSRADYFKLAAQGNFLPLDEYLDDLPNYKNTVSEELLSSVQVDGVTYALPFRNTVKFTNGIYGRTDLLKELNMEAPETLDELYAVLSAIKDTFGMTPFTLAASTPGELDGSAAPIAGAFGVSTITVEREGKLAFSWTEPEYKAFLTFMNKLYNEGLMDQEFALNKGSNMKEKLIGEQAAFATMAWWDAKTTYENLSSKREGVEMHYLGLPAGPEGERGIIESNPFGGYHVIPQGAKNPEGAIRVMDYFATEEALFTQDWGVEGRDHAMENGKPVSSDEQMAQIPWRILYQLADTQENYEARLESKGFTPYHDQLTGYEMVREETFYAPPIDEWSNKFNELQSFKDENAVKFIMGTRSLDEFDRFVEEFNARGGKSAIDAMNEWYTTKD
ncbi:extracellular solute-binding protein [Paenibacillus daejeonensis]|uniref:extracellular solute-binding protein n=1 Tax=Paenibacillus daejeonensis TaxID=135193 RepID=UPI00035DA146|nr:extracellular solute-binding protein [Paenibacillus daejeonensis]